MSERTDQHGLVKLGDSEYRLETPEQDIRGLDVYDRDGRETGSVEALYIDTEERKVRFQHFMIPVEAVTDVGEDRVTIEHGREKVTGSPPLRHQRCTPHRRLPGTN